MLFSMLWWWLDFFLITLVDKPKKDSLRKLWWLIYKWRRYLTLQTLKTKTKNKKFELQKISWKNKMSRSVDILFCIVGMIAKNLSHRTQKSTTFEVFTVIWGSRPKKITFLADMFSKALNFLALFSKMREVCIDPSVHLVFYEILWSSSYFDRTSFHIHLDDVLEVLLVVGLIFLQNL